VKLLRCLSFSLNPSPTERDFGYGGFIRVRIGKMRELRKLKKWEIRKMSLELRIKS